MWARQSVAEEIDTPPLHSLRGGDVMESIKDYESFCQSSSLCHRATLNLSCRGHPRIFIQTGNQLLPQRIRLRHRDSESYMYGSLYINLKFWSSGNYRFVTALCKSAPRSGMVGSTPTTATICFYRLNG